ncbi:hypothetical protein BDV33DRAFT_184480 [Aspergillus novoparasiticus]|uniref:Uncharacterized protein n=1 Tax=Aspergillus novoparasiticus TaxID=986946 RepID=A0A5N6E8G5_9EURO|nr:hypothetical protein BDV33DRAFT_184480 [Aspergillus novoparasiticus]
MEDGCRVSVVARLSIFIYHSGIISSSVVRLTMTSSLLSLCRNNVNLGLYHTHL